MMYVLMHLIYYTTTPIVLSMTFATYVWTGNQISAQVAFTTIILFTLLQGPMITFPASLSEIFQIWSSMKRI